MTDSATGVAEGSISKNEQKRQLKLAKKAAEKAEKEKDASPNPSDSDKTNEDQLSPNEYFKIRSRAVEELKLEEGGHPYPHKFHVSQLPQRLPGRLHLPRGWADSG